MNENEVAPHETTTKTSKASLPGSDVANMVCFGRIADVHGTCDRRAGPGRVFYVQLDSANRFSSDESGIKGEIASIHGNMIEGLISEPTLSLFTLCLLSPDDPTKLSTDTSSLDRRNCTLEIAVYGPMELFDEIGAWFQDYDVYLQDPRVCDVDVKYCNPQKLNMGGLDNCPLVSQVISHFLMSQDKLVIQGANRILRKGRNKS